MTSEQAFASLREQYPEDGRVIDSLERMWNDNPDRYMEMCETYRRFVGSGGIERLHAHADWLHGSSGWA